MGSAMASIGSGNDHTCAGAAYEWVASQGSGREGLQLASPSSRRFVVCAGGTVA